MKRFATFGAFTLFGGLLGPLPAAAGDGEITLIHTGDFHGHLVARPNVVVHYLESLPERTADTQLNRIRLLAPLPAAKFGFPEVQPLRGGAR